MGIWTGIKKTINSTLGTPDFKPLDEIIRGQRSLAASDNTIAAIVSSETGIKQQNYFYFNNIFKAKTNGTIRINTEIKAGAPSWNSGLRIYKNGEQIVTFATNGESNKYLFFTSDININEGDIISFVGWDYLWVKYLHIGAIIVDGSLFEIGTQEE
jgi:hypothetical protein